ncbi:MAG: endonuclease/exonuclease/phosphatase family protein [Propionibacteriaceae bacterium]|nr:endonuclease/exonuclease/phosphatase family protein [Propionibacteriaceae bacterium]
MFLAFAGLGSVLLAAIHLLLPSSGLNEALSTVPVIAQGLAFPLPGGLALVLMGMVVLLTVVLRPRRQGALSRRPALVTATCVALSGVLLALSATGVGLPSPRGNTEVDANASLVMVSWNALDHFDAESAEQIFGGLAADVAVLPELENRDGGAGAHRIQEALAGGGLDPTEYDIFESPPTGTHIAPLAVIVRRGFGIYASVAVEQVTFGTVHLVPPAGSGLPEIVALHTAPPVPRWMAAWEADLTRVRDLAQNAGGNSIIAGDLNATLRHGAMGGITSHADVLTSAPAVERGTWPATAPPVLRSSIDHVLIPTSAFAVGDAGVLDITGSDHAAVVTRIFFRP